MESSSELIECWSDLERPSRRVTGAARSELGVQPRRTSNLKRCAGLRRVGVGDEAGGVQDEDQTGLGMWMRGIG